MAKRRIKHNAAPAALHISGHLRVAIIAAGVLIALVLLILVIRPENQLMNRAEIATTKRLGVLKVGLQEGVVGFSQDGEGLEPYLAKVLTKQIFPNKDVTSSMEIVTVNPYTALAKLDTGEIDIAFAMKERSTSSLYAYSQPYYKDTVWMYCNVDMSRAQLLSQTVGVVQNTTAVSLLERFNEDNGCTLTDVKFASYPDLLDGLRAGKVYFAAIPAAYARLLPMEGYAQHITPLGELSYVAACRADTSAYVELMDRILEDLDSNGSLATVYAQNGLG